MPRQPREKSKTGIYHVLTRGINRQHIFVDSEDKRIYLDRLSTYKEKCAFQIYAYCLMSNHVHLLIKEGDVPISEIMKKLNTSYVYWFNRKYNRVGHLFQDRFMSEPVEDDRYLLTLIRYIHQNPVKVGQSISEWTSYDDYVSNSGLAESSFVLKIFNDDISKAVEQFRQYVNKSEDHKCMDVESSGRVTDEEAKALILRVGNISYCQQLQDFERTDRDTVLRKLKDDGLSIRQIERLSGINRGIILNA